MILWFKTIIKLTIWTWNLKNYFSRQMMPQPISHSHVISKITFQASWCSMTNAWLRLVFKKVLIPYFNNIIFARVLKMDLQYCKFKQLSYMISVMSLITHWHLNTMCSPPLYFCHFSTLSTSTHFWCFLNTIFKWQYLTYQVNWHICYQMLLTACPSMWHQTLSQH